jgi:uncharacterized membrane protein
MKTSRLEAFSDGVIAVIITIMVLELKVPREATPQALLAILPSFLAYGLSFGVVAIMWVNHHHFLQMAKRADAALLWSNNNLLFWMSLVPFATAYLGQNCHQPFAVAVYGAEMTATCAAFFLLQCVLGCQDPNDDARRATFTYLNWKSITAIVSYAASIGLAYISVYIAYAIFVIFPLLYFWPERKGEVR